MSLYQVMNPRARKNPLNTSRLAERPDTLDGKTIALVSNKKYHLDILTMEMVKQFPKTNFIFIPDSAVVPGQTTIYRELPAPVKTMKFFAFMKHPEIADLIITGCGFCANAAATVVEQACKFEKMGIPSVVIGIKAMVSNMQNTVLRQAASMPYLRMAITDGMGETPEDVLEMGLTAQLMEDCIKALTDPLTEQERFVGAYHLPEEPEYLYEGDDYKAAMDSLITDDFRCPLVAAPPTSYTDGSAVQLPLPHLVDEMLAGTSHSPDEVIGVLGECNATVRLAAINGVMAGCRPSYMPMLLALTECMVNSDCMKRLGGAGGYFGFGAVFNGDIYPGEIKLNDGGPASIGPATLTPSVLPNTTAGRFMRLMMVNVGAAEPGIFEGKGSGNPHKTSIVIREASDSLWPQMSTDIGFEDGEDTVSFYVLWGDMLQGYACKYNGPEATNEKEALIQKLLGPTAQASKMLCNYDKGLFLYLKNNTVTQLSNAGITRQEVKEWLSTHIVDTYEDANRLFGVGENSIIDVWTVQGKVVQPLSNWPEEWKDPDFDKKTVIQYYPNPENISIVAGFGGIMTNGGLIMNGAPRWTTRIEPWR